VYLLLNPTKSEFEMELKVVQNRVTALVASKTAPSFATVYFSGHGNKDEICMIDGTIHRDMFRDLVDPTTNAELRSFAYTPKLLFWDCERLDSVCKLVIRE
jgi:hypothetical protein